MGDSHRINQESENQKMSTPNDTALPERSHNDYALEAISFEGLMVHVDGIIQEANQVFASLLGYASPSEIVGKSVMQIMPLTPASRQCLQVNFASEEKETHEIELIGAGGAVFPAEVQCETITYHDHPARLVIMHEIKNRKLTEINLTRQIERLQVLHTIEQAVTGVLDIQQILQLFVQQMVEKIHVDACSILILNSQTQTLDFAAKQGFLTHALEFTRLKIGMGLAGQAARDRRAIFIPDLTEIKDNPSLMKAIADENFLMYISLPLIAKDNLLGVLEIFYRTKFLADQNWISFLEILANEAAIAIDNARLMSLAQQSFKETSALYQINKKLIASIDPQELMDEVVNLLQQNFGYLYVQIFVTDSKSGDVVMRAGSGELGARLKKEGYKLSQGDGIIGVTAETGKPFFTNDVESVFTFIRPPYLTETRSELAVPIITDNKFLGLLDIHQKDPIQLTERDVQLVTAVADQLAVALQKAMLYSDLQTSLQQEHAARSLLIHNEKLAIAGRLLASVSHELNNPIQAIQNALFLLRNEQNLSEQGKQDLDTVLSETERMAGMLARLRNTYKRVSTVDFKPVDVNAIIQEVGTLVASHLRQHQIFYKVEIDPTLPLVSGLEDQIRQVILNLVMNSVEAMPKGGHLNISSQSLPDTHEILLTVTDTGSGIQEDIFANIFEAFITNKEHGTGLGLTISHEIISRHNGRIEAHNNPSGGACMQIWLPALENNTPE